MIDFKLWDHQKEALEKAKDKECYALLFDCGTGKTLCSIQIVRHKFKVHKQILPTLILAPVIVLENWREEWQKFSNVPDERVLILNGPVKKRIKLLNEGLERLGNQLIVITNYEGIVSSDAFFNDIYTNLVPDVLIVDESQRIKSHSSKRTKLVIKLADQTKYKYLLTGTPILNSLLDIYSQFRVLDNGESFGSNFYSFRARYFYDKNIGMPNHVHFPNWVVRPEAYEEVKEKIYKKAMRVKKEDCLTLPPLVKQKIYVELSPKQNKLYEEMLNNFVTSLDDKVVSADMALTKTLRMLQIVTGFIKDDDNNLTSFETPRKKAIKELLSDICEHSKVLVWCCFKENYAQIRDICTALKIKFVEAHGEISSNAKYEAINSFNTNPDYKVLIGHPGSLGVGVNLVSASYSIYYSRTYNLEHDIQSEARNYRGGSEIHQKITRIDIVAKDTIDEIIMDSLANKFGEAEKILSFIKNRLTTLVPYRKTL